MKTLRVVKTKNMWQAAVGLIGSEKPYPLLLHTRFGIHTFGLRFPIDILILDDTHSIVRIKKKVSPNRIYFWPPKWNIVLELPPNTIAKKHIMLGESIHLHIS